MLEAIGTELPDRREELGTLLAREEGKTRAEGVGEATRAGQIFLFFAGEALRISGELLASARPGIDVEITREPLGPVVAITPWNFPLAIPAWKIAPALAYGNTVVFKPAELVPACAWALADVIARAGVPAGVFNLVMGRGGEIGDALVQAPGLAGVTFTGSVETGRRVAALCVARGVRVQAEMGGKNPLVVLGDADLDVAVECAVQGAYYSTGQRCTASSRLIVTRDVHDEFVERLIARLAEQRVGHALAAGTDIGPLVDERQLRRSLDYVALGAAEGAELAFGGERLQLEWDGFYMEPALFVGADNGMRISREEIFGPVACVIAADDLEDALAIANDTEFGLVAGVVTSSLRSAKRFQREARTGMTMVNLPTAGVDFHVPFGGTKASSYGPREQGRYAREFFTVVKTGYLAA